jgi:hypothetical protein
MQPIGSTVSLIILAASTSRQFEFQKRSQFFTCTDNETLSVVAMCVSNPYCPPLTINGRNAAPTSSGFAEIVSDDFPVSFHGAFTE